MDACLRRHDGVTAGIFTQSRCVLARHPAALNFGDCCSYALAAEPGLPLLFKGSDFGQTDIASAIAYP